MKKTSLFLVGVLLVFLVIFVSNAIAYEELSCPKVKIVLQHKNMAIKLTFGGVPSPIVDEKGSRCRTTKEVIDMIMNFSPDFYLVEYNEDYN